MKELILSELLNVLPLDMFINIVGLNGKQIYRCKVCDNFKYNDIKDYIVLMIDINNNKEFNVYITNEIE